MNLLKFLKGLKEKNLPLDSIEDGSIYHCEDTGNTYLGKEIKNEDGTTARKELLRYSSAVGQTVISFNEDGEEVKGEIFNDYTNNQATGSYSHAEGSATIACGDISHAEGNDTLAEGYGAHAEGCETKASGDMSHAEGYRTLSVGSYSHTEGKNTQTIGQGSHAEGGMGVAFGDYSHVEGNGIGIPIELIGNGPTYTVNDIGIRGDEWLQYVSPFSYFNIKNGNILKYIDDATYETKYCFVESVDLDNNQITLSSEGSYYGFEKDTDIPFDKTINIYDYVFEIPSNNPVVYLVSVSGENSHSEGIASQALGEGSHVEGINTLALEQGAHAEGRNTLASGNTSHAEGEDTKATGYGSHAEGGNTTANGDYSHAEGIWTIASGYVQHVQGKYNIEDTENKYAHIVGNGDDNERSNAHTLDWEGNAWFAGDVYVKGTGQSDTENVHKLSYDSIEQQNPDSDYKHIKFWVGTQEQLDAIEDKEDDCLYFATGGEEVSGPIIKIITLNNGNWDANSLTQTVEVEGVIADPLKQIITVSPHSSNREEYLDNGIQCILQEENALIFKADSIPALNLLVYVAIQGAGSKEAVN